MSTAYNRRRGAKANASRKLRECRATFKEANDQGMETIRPCHRIAQVNRYCPDHQRTLGTVAAAA